MPNIKPYTQEERIQSSQGGYIPLRNARGEDFGGPGLAYIGRSIGEEGVQAALKFQEAKEREEVTDAQVKLAQFEANWTTELDAQARTVNLDEYKAFSAKFNESMQPKLQALGDKYETRVGQQAFQRGAGELTGHFLRQAGLAQAHMGGLKAKQDWVSYENAARNSVLDNPLTYERKKQLMLESLNDPNGQYFGHLKSEDRAIMSRTAVENLAESAVRGIIRAGAPELALAQLNSGEWNNDLNAKDKENLERSADIAIKAKEAEKARVSAADEKLRKDLARKIESDLVLKLGGGTDGKDKLTGMDVIKSNLIEVDPERARSLINEIHTRSREQALPIVTVGQTMLNLEKGIREGTITDELALSQAYNHRQLSWEDYTHLRNELANWRTPEGKTLIDTKGKFLDGIKHQITKANPMLGQLDPTGDQDFFEFSQSVARKIDEYKKTKKNPYDLFDPSKPEYLGRPDGMILRYQKTMGESMNTISRNLSRKREVEPPSGVLPRLPGETPAEWKKRRDKQ